MKEMEVVAFLEDPTYTSTVRKSNPDSPFWQLFLDLEFAQEGRWRILFLDLELCGVGVTFAASVCELVLVSLCSGALPSVVCAGRVCEEGVSGCGVFACVSLALFIDCC